jgi:hypothetical protein
MEFNSNSKKFEINNQLRQIEEEELVLKKNEGDLSNEIKNLKKSNVNLIEKIQDQSKLTKEKEQEKIILDETNSLLEKKILEIVNIQENLKENLSKKIHLIKELEQEKLIFSDIVSDQTKENKYLKKKYLFSAIVIIIFIGILTPYSLSMTSLVLEEEPVQMSNPIKSGYVIQNLKGDTIDTYLSWRLVEGDTIYVNILNSAQLEPELIEIVKKTILSEEVLEIDNSLLQKGDKGTVSHMFVGWKGALSDISKQETVLSVPTNFEIIESNNGVGDITIELTNKKSADGFSGWTISRADESQNQILKSNIIIFDIDNISKAQLETITRHEFGHALGLAHATDPTDLMYPEIITPYPYISECDVDAIILLYDGGTSSQVICET